MPSTCTPMILGATRGTAHADRRLTAVLLLLIPSLATTLMVSLPTPGPPPLLLYWTLAKPVW